MKLSFPVAYQYFENAFNECKLLTRDKSKRNNALVDDKIRSVKQLKKESITRINSAVILTPIKVDFINKKTER